VASSLNIEDFLDPCDNFMGTGIGGLIKVNHTIFEILFKSSFEWSGSCGDRCIVCGENIHFVIVFE
jgi:hypothetical protein